MPNRKRLLTLGLSLWATALRADTGSNGFQTGRILVGFNSQATEDNKLVLYNSALSNELKRIGHSLSPLANAAMRSEAVDFLNETGSRQRSARRPACFPHIVKIVAAPEEGTPTGTLSQVLTLGSQARIEFRRGDASSCVDVEMSRS